MSVARSALPSAASDPAPGSGQAVYKIAIDHSFSPFSMINTTGEAAGLFVDLWRLWAETNGYEVEFNAAEWPQTLDMVQRGEVDFHSGMLMTAERKKQFDFSREFYETSSAIYTSNEDPRIEDISALTGRKIGVFKGSYHESYLKKRAPEAEVATFSTSRKMIRATLDGQIDAFFAEIPFISQTLVRKGLAGSLRHGSHPIVTEAFFAAVGKGNAGLLEVINQGLENIPHAQLVEIEKRWIPDPVGYFFDAHTLSPEILLTHSEKQWIRSHSIVRLGSDTTWPPFEFTDDSGGHNGICVDYMQVLGKRLGLHIKLQPNPPLSKLPDNIGRNQLDGAVCLSKTKSRETTLAFTQPYINASSVIITRVNYPPVTDVSDFNGKTVAVEKGYYPAEKLGRDYPAIKLYSVTDTSAALRAVSANLADAYVGNMAVATWYLEHDIITNLKVNGPEVEYSRLRIAIRKDWPQLVSLLQKGLDSITLQEKQAIQRKWIPIAEELFRAGKRVRLSPEEKRFVRQNSVITFSEMSREPLHSIDAEGQPYGMSIDYLNLVAEKTSLTFQFSPTSTWADVVDRIRDRTLDMAPATGKTDIKETYALFSEPYLSFPLVIVTRNDVTYIKDAGELAGKDVLVGNRYASHDYLRENYPELDLLPVSNVPAGLEMLAGGEAFALVANMATATYHIQQLGLTNLKISGTTDFKFDIRTMVRKDLPELVGILNKGLEAITTEEKNAIYYRWLPIQYKSQVDKRLAWNVVMIAAVVIAVALFWNWVVQGQKEAIRISEERFQMAMMAAADGLWDWNLRTGDVYYSPGYMKMLGYQPTELAATQQTWESLLHPEDKAKATQYVENAIANAARHYEHEFRLKTKPGAYVDIHSSGAVVEIDRDGNAVRAVGTQTDITELKKATLALEKAKQDAEQASQFKSDFLANMSHEIRTPMNAVIGLSHLALQTSLTSKQRDYLTKIKGSSDNLLAIVNDILDFSKIEAGRLQLESVDFSLDEIFNNLADLFRLKADEKNVEIAFDVNRDVPKRLIGDPLRLQQVLINLVSNAVKFTEAGMVIIGARLLESRHQGAVVHFSVKDPGIGLSREQINGLFQAFHQADQSTTRHYGGTGLGLAISKKLIEMMHGKIGVESRPGQGSTFFFTIEADVPTETESSLDGQSRFDPQTPQFPSASYPPLTGKILLVEDNPLNRQVAGELLESYGLSVEYANNGLEAISAVRDDHYDIVFMDVQMPEMDGLDATRIIRNELGLDAIPIIAMTANAMVGDDKKSLAAGMNHHINKPIDPDAVYQEVKRWLPPLPLAVNHNHGNAPLDESPIPQYTDPDNMRQAIARIGGNRNLLSRLLREFHTDHHDDLDKIRTALNSGDFRSAQRFIHTIKGIAGNIGATELAASAETSEKYINDDSSSEAGAAMQQFCTDFYRLMAILKDS